MSEFNSRVSQFCTSSLQKGPIKKKNKTKHTYTHKTKQKTTTAKKRPFASTPSQRRICNRPDVGHTWTPRSWGQGPAAAALLTQMVCKIA